jgi:hypothetical protein
MDIIDRTSGNDLIVGGTGDDIINGCEGDDHLRVGAGNNLIHGGDFRAYGGAARTALSADGTDTADFGGVTNGIEIRFPALASTDPTNKIADTRYKTLLGVDYNSALFVKSRTLASSFVPASTNTLVSIEKIKGSDASDVLYLGETATNGGAITEIDFAGESGRGYPGGDLIVLGWKDKKVEANLADKQNQLLTGTPIGKDANGNDVPGSPSQIGLKFKNAESIIATAKNDVIYAAENGFVIAGNGDDEIHLQAGSFAMGGIGKDKFYVKTKYNNKDASYVNDVFILDFNPEEDTLYVDNVLFTGYKKYTRFIEFASGPDSSGAERAVYGQILVDKAMTDRLGFSVPKSTSSFGLAGLDLNPQTYLQYQAGKQAFQNGQIRDVNVAGLDNNTDGINLGRIQFIDANIALKPNQTSEIDSSNTSLNRYLNLYIGQTWTTQNEVTNGFYHSIDGIDEGNNGRVNIDGRYGSRSGIDNFLGDSQAPRFVVRDAIDGAGQLPYYGSYPAPLTGFDADNNIFYLSAWNASQQSTVRILKSSDVNGGLGLGASPFATFSFASNSSNSPDGFSFIYDGSLTVTLPVDISRLDFSESASKLGRFDLPPLVVSGLSSSLGLLDLGVLTQKTESLTGQYGSGRAKIAGDGNETLVGTSGSDLLMGGAGNNILTANNINNNSAQNDLLIGGEGDDIYNVGGVFDMSIVAERLDVTEAAGGYDVLNLNFASTTLSFIEGNDAQDIRIFVPGNFVGSGGEGGEGYTPSAPILTIASQLSDDADDWIEEFRFSDGVVWTRQQLLQNVVTAQSFNGLTAQPGPDYRYN